MRRAPPPTSVEALVRSAEALEGRTFASLAADAGVEVPPDLRRAKGWLGQVVEAALGAAGGSRPEPDFCALGVELKTLPVAADGAPRESTYVCTAPTEGVFDPTWEDSHVRRKLANILWVELRGERSTAPGERTIGRARLWSPTPEEEALLKR